MRLALVTGGAKGIGRAIAQRLLEDGLQVAIADIGETVDALPKAYYYKSDIARIEEAQQLAAQLEARGAVDVLVNNAGIRGPTVPVTGFPLAEWEAVLRVNLTGAFLCTQLLAPGMQKKRWGRIVNISSMAGRGPYPLRSAYAASKWGLNGLTLTLAQELGPDGITVNSVCPGPVENAAMQEVMRLRADAVGKSLDEVRTEYLQHLAIPQLPVEQDVANMVSYLVSESAWSITGQCIEVSSGYRA